MISSNPQWNQIFEKMLDHSVSEVEVNGPDLVFIKQRGKRIHLDDIFWDSEEDYARSVEEAVVPVTQSMNMYEPDNSIFEGRMMFSGANSDGEKVDVQARCHVMLPPVCDYPQITLAKRSKTLTTLDSLASMGSMSTEMLQFLEMAVESNLTIVFSGQTGSGKDLSGNTLIPTPTGFKKMVDIAVGDLVFNDEGKPVVVKNKYAPERDRKYRVTFSNGTQELAGEGHLWRVQDMQSVADSERLYSVKALLNYESFVGAEVLSRGDDEYVTISDFLKEISYTPVNKQPGLEIDTVDPVVEILEGLAVDSGDLFAITVRSLIDSNKLLFASGPNEAEIERRLRAWDRVEISLNELFSLCDHDEDMFERVAVGNAPRGYQVVNSREAASALLKEQSRRTEIRARRKGDTEANVTPFKNVTTQQMFDSINEHRRGDTSKKVDRPFFAIERVSGPVVFDNKETLPLHPYLYGLWLGGGNGGDGRVLSTNRRDVVEEIKAYLVTECGVKQNEVSVDDKNTVDVDGEPLSMLKYKPLRATLKSLYGNGSNKNFPKEISDVFLLSSPQERRQLLAGLIDGGGEVSKDARGNCTFTTVNLRLVEQVRSVVSSLGLSSSSVRMVERSIEKDGEKIRIDPAYSVEFLFDYNSFGINEHSVSMSQRASNELISGKKMDSNRLYVLDVEPYEPTAGEEFFCLEVDTPSHLFLCGETYIPTHNTTMLEAVSKLIPDTTRIGVAEDAPELNLIQDNVTYLHSVPWAPGMDENEVATLQWVVSQFQRNRCDKLIIGETRGKEFGDFLIAANSGMEGSMTTIHANNPVQCLSKMSNFAMKASDKQPIRAINADIAGAIDIIVQLVVVDGRHRVSHIAEVIPTLGTTEEAKITQATLYQWNRLDDTFEKVGNMSDNLRRILDSRGADYRDLLQTPIGEKVKCHKYGQNAAADNFGSNANNAVPGERTRPRRALGVDGVESTTSDGAPESQSRPRRGLPPLGRRGVSAPWKREI